MTPIEALIAAICHDANRRYCMSIGDFTQPLWDDAPDWQKASAIDGVSHLLRNPDAGPRESHENWLRVKEADGWVYGRVKDADKKQHPCMVAYDELPEDQQMKDAIFHAIVGAFRPIFA